MLQSSEPWSDVVKPYILPQSPS